MPTEILELQHWEAWETPPDGKRPAGLRITTDVQLPFELGTLLKAALGPEGFEFDAPELDITLLLTPKPGPGAHALFERSLACLMPVTLTEVDFPANQQRTWLATPVRKRFVNAE